MQRKKRRAAKRRLSPLALGLAVLVHIVLLALVFIRIETHVQPVAVAPPKKPLNVVDAVAVDGQALEREKERKRQLELEKKRRIEQEKRRKEEQRRKAEAEKKRKAEAERKKREAAARKKREAEKKKKAEAERKKKEEAARRKREAEKKKKAEAERKRKKAAAEKKRREEAARKKREADLKKKMAAEARQRRAAAALNQYVPRIQARVESNWRLPPGGAAGCNPTVRVTLARDGTVQSARVVKSSGNSYCDRSVETAFMRASPIPIPSDPELYPEFKVIDFPFRP